MIRNLFCLWPLNQNLQHTTQLDKNNHRTNINTYKNVINPITTISNMKFIAREIT
jgi:hypothetical protein